MIIIIIHPGILADPGISGIPGIQGIPESRDPGLALLGGHVFLQKLVPFHCGRVFVQKLVHFYCQVVTFSYRN